MLARLSLGLVVALLLSTNAEAHTLLTEPQPRNNEDGLKTGPCGGVERTDSPKQLTPGDTLMVEWFETVDHPGYYRIALSLTGDEGFDDNVLADNIPDVDCTSTPCNYTQEIIVPDVECENCTLQMIQYMGNAAPYRPYFSCADVQISGDGQDPPVEDEDPSIGTVEGGCSVNGRGANGLAVLVLFGIVLACRRACRRVV